MYIMKEITPFLYTSLYPHGCLENFEQLNAKFSTHMLTHENKKAWSVGVRSVSPSHSRLRPPTTTNSAGDTSSAVEEELRPSDQEPLHIIVPIVEPPVPVMPLPRRFSPKKPDTLFWSLFVAHYGVDTFLQIGSKYMNREIEEKTHTMEFLGKNRSLQKSLKITAASGQEIMGDLMTNKQTTLAMLPAFAMFYKKTLWVVSETSRTYHVFRGQMAFTPSTTNSAGDLRSPDEFGHADEMSDEDVYVIYRSTGVRGVQQYSAETVVTPEILEKIRTQYFQLDSIMKPLKGPGNFKMGDLEQMIQKLEIKLEEGLKMKKGEMYETILKHCVIAWI